MRAQKRVQKTTVGNNKCPLDLIGGEGGIYGDIYLWLRLIDRGGLSYRKGVAGVQNYL